MLDVRSCSESIRYEIVYWLLFCVIPVYWVKPAAHCWLAVLVTAASTGMSARRYASAKCGVAQSTTVTVTSAGSGDGGAARQSPALRSIHFSTRAAIVGSAGVGVAGAADDGEVDIGEVVEVAAVGDCFAPQPANHPVEARATAIPATERNRLLLIATSSILSVPSDFIAMPATTSVAARPLRVVTADRALRPMLGR